MEHIHLHTKRNRGYFLALIIGLLFITAFSSCKKDNDEVQQPDVSFITFVQSSPLYSSLDFYIGGVRTTSALLYTENSGRYLNGSTYLGIYSGPYFVQVGVGGSTQQLLGGTLNFEPNKSYSFFVTTKSAATDSASAIITTDTLTAPSSGKAKIRFVNVGRSTGAFDLAIQNGATLFSNKAYNAYTSFTEVNAGTYTYVLKDAGTSTVRATSQPLIVEGGRIYTIWAGGTSTGTGTSALSLNVIVNK